MTDRAQRFPIRRDISLNAMKADKYQYRRKRPPYEPWPHRVMPAKTGIHDFVSCDKRKSRIPAFASLTRSAQSMGHALRRPVLNAGIIRYRVVGGDAVSLFYPAGARFLVDTADRGPKTLLGRFTGWNTHDGRAGADRARGGLAAGGVGVALIGVPLVLTLYLSVFNEKLILFPPHAYTLGLVPADPCRRSARRSGPACSLASPPWPAACCWACPRASDCPATVSPAKRWSAHCCSPRSPCPASPSASPSTSSWSRIDVHAGTALTGSLTGLVLAHLLITTPWVVRLCLASLATHDRAAEEAAASLGAHPFQVIWRVTLPAMRPGIIAGALFAFVISFENLELALFLTSPGSDHAAGCGFAIS